MTDRETHKVYAGPQFKDAPTEIDWQKAERELDKITRDYLRRLNAEALGCTKSLTEMAGDYK